MTALKVQPSSPELSPDRILRSTQEGVRHRGGRQIRFKIGTVEAHGLARIEMLVVGRELLIGRTINTNSHWVGKRLAVMGTMIARITTVDDDLREISSSLEEVMSRRPDFLIVVGGLGPTPDDMTLRGVGMGLGREMRLSRPALQLIREHYAQIGRSDFRITAARRKMAVLPEGATPLPNQKGTAPGVRLLVGSTVVFCLPGVPVEMKSIFAHSVAPEVKSRIGRLYRAAARLKLEGIFESALAPMIAKELTKHPAAYIKSHPRGVKDGVSRIELDAVVVDRRGAIAKETVEGIVKSLGEKVGRAGGRIVWAHGVQLGNLE